MEIFDTNAEDPHRLHIMVLSVESEKVNPFNVDEFPQEQRYEPLKKRV